MEQKLTLKVLDLFSGIGGFSLGLERAGMSTAAFCEIEPYCRKVLRKHWPDVPIFEDVRKLNATDITETIDLICGGYPCQPFSAAGKRRGSEDDRYLWTEYLRLIQELSPRWVVAENVAGHISMGLDQVLSDLESENYKSWTFVIPAVGVDAPHKRDRIWIVAYANSTRSDRNQNHKICARWDSIESCFGSLANTNRTGQQKQYATRLAERKGFDSWFSVEKRGKTRWPAEPGVGRVADGVSCRVDRLKALGNAVIPQIPEIIGRAIMQIELCY
ncbi:DNA cytosine methyltransferase [Desulforhopalus singaporensis]|uniref:Cytosine-specific methyltransferase n=1 Tax=Desulforhopalus singaporensis TaxID=91360 RepID=A0A1H0W1M8_9BACT|nr:DNA (cytosine-5-)-methyltransferase [Desulforhopalus singaporensis]SDP84366.1 DNA (cytosine-5)-methyltransferase 1 [Desulforhopalus singaporensis]SDP84599.1 DNA (cytosine-5)-methyltransferase 1 [Desulforhopalus singaporensis]